MKQHWHCQKCGVRATTFVRTVWPPAHPCKKQLDRWVELEPVEEK